MGVVGGYVHIWVKGAKSEKQMNRVEGLVIKRNNMIHVTLENFCYFENFWRYVDLTLILLNTFAADDELARHSGNGVRCG